MRGVVVVVRVRKGTKIYLPSLIAEPFALSVQLVECRLNKPTVRTLRYGIRSPDDDLLSRIRSFVVAHSSYLSHLIQICIFFIRTRNRDDRRLNLLALQFRRTSV